MYSPFFLKTQLSCVLDVLYPLAYFLAYKCSFFFHSCILCVDEAVLNEKFYFPQIQSETYAWEHKTRKR